MSNVKFRVRKDESDYLVGAALVLVIIGAIAFLPPLGIFLTMGLLSLTVAAWIAGLIKLRNFILWMVRLVNIG